MCVCVYVLIRHLHWSKWHLSHSKYQTDEVYKISVKTAQAVSSTLLGNTCGYLCSSTGSCENQLCFLQLVDDMIIKQVGEMGTKSFLHESYP